MFKRYILKAFDLREEELTKTLLLQLNIFIIITTLLIVKPTINSLFLSELTANALPLGYVLTATMAIVGSFFYNKALGKYPLNIIIDRTLIGSIFSLLLFSVLFHFNLATSFLLYIPYIWVAIFGLLAASQFWILANLVYNIREAKRVFGFIGAGGIAGGIFGGYLTAFLASFLHTEYLLVTAAFLLAFCIPITRYIWKNEVVALNTFQVSIRTSPKEDSPFKLIQQSKLLSYIALDVGISVLVAKLVDYQYSAYASEFIRDPDELASFFGFWFSTLGVISLIIQLFFTQYIVGTFGVGQSLLWLPVGIFMGSTLLLLIPQLWVIVCIKVVDGSLKQSVNKAANELLSIPIPIDIKKKTKTFTDVVVDSIATGIAGFILIFFVNGLNIPSTYISLIIICLIMIWLFLIYKLKKEYIRAFKALLDPLSAKKEKASKKEIKIRTIVGTVNRVLQTGTEGQILFMLRKTLQVKDERFFVSIKNLLRHESHKVRALAIANLYSLKTENLEQQIEKMIYDPNQDVTTAAFRYLIKKYTQNTVILFSKYLNVNDKTISNAALIGLSLELRNNELLQDRFSLYDSTLTALKQYNEITIEVDKTNKMCAILEAIGNARLEKLYDVIKTNLKSENNQILKTAIISASRTLDRQFIDLIISHLSEKGTRNIAIKALYFYNDSIIDILHHKIIANKMDLDDAAYCILVIEKFESQKAVNTLINLINNTEHLVKMETIEALKRLKWKHPQLKIKDRFVVHQILDECQLYQSTLAAIHSQIIIRYKNSTENEETKAESEARNGLIHLLEHRLDRQLLRIFRFLGIKYPPHEIDTVLKTIMDGKEEDRAHAIEFLDNILDVQLKRELIPVTESILIDTFSEEKITKLNLKVLSEIECYHELLMRKDSKLKFAVLYLIEQSKNKKFIPLLEMLLEQNNGLIDKRVEDILNTL